MAMGGGLLLLTFTISAHAQCNLPCGIVGNGTIDCPQSPLTTYTLSGNVSLPPSPYTCTGITLMFNSASNLTLNNGTQLTLGDSLINDSKSQFVFQNFMKLRQGSQLNLNGVTLSSPTIFLIDTEKAMATSTPIININRTSANKTVLNFTEIVLNGNAQLTAGTDHCNAPDPFCNELYDIVTRDRASLTLNNVKMHNFFAEANGSLLGVGGRIALSNIPNGYGDPLQTPKPLVSFTCPSPPICSPSAPCCSGTPYQLMVNATYIQEFRFNVNNGGTAVLSNIGATVVDFEEGLGCDWTFGNGELPYVKVAGACVIAKLPSVVMIVRAKIFLHGSARTSRAGQKWIIC
ncbi:MAG: hypothetical protein HYR55_11810 [Acidobacteria bacterium]|nr:hypothetical protein [Acidobacteriota bacterium]